MCRAQGQRLLFVFAHPLVDPVEDTVPDLAVHKLQHHAAADDVRDVQRIALLGQHQHQHRTGHTRQENGRAREHTKKKKNRTAPTIFKGALVSYDSRCGSVPYNHVKKKLVSHIWLGRGGGGTHVTRSRNNLTYGYLVYYIIVRAWGTQMVGKSLTLTLTLIPNDHPNIRKKKTP